MKLLTLMMTCPDPEDAAARDAMRRGVAFYCASKHYHHIGELSGFGDEVRRVYEVWQTGDFAAASREVSDALVEKMTLTGSRAKCRAQLRALLDAGVYPIIYPIPRRDRMVEDHTAAIRIAASYLEMGAR